MNRRLTLLFLFVFFAMLLAACGGASDDSAEAPAPAASSEQSAAEQEPAAEMADEPSEAPAEESGQEPAVEASASGMRYVINQAQSSVSFELDEMLRGQPKTVVGTTNQVSGEFNFDFSDLSTAQVGPISIDAGSLATDNNFRNRAIQQFILETGDYPTITFTPSSIDGLPASAAIGEEISFSISGELTIRAISQPVTFEVTASAVSESQVQGSATAIVAREAFDLRIPDVPNVANVEEEVELTITFSADGA